MHLFLIAFAALVLLLLYHQFVQRRKSLPPGPVPLPLVGNLLQVDFNNQIDCFSRLGKQYGGIYTLFLGPNPVVFITDYEILKEAFIGMGDAFAGRQEYTVQNLRTDGKYGLGFGDGPLWREHRRFALHTLRDFGVSRGVMEDKINFDLDRLVEYLKLHVDGDAVDVGHGISVCVASVVANLVLGQRYDYDDADFAAQRDAVDELFSQMSTTRFLLDDFAWLRHVPLFGHFGYDEITDAANRVRAIFQAVIAKRKAEIDAHPSEEPTDYVEAYLNEQRARNEIGDDRRRDVFSDWQLFASTMDLWNAGVETTVSTLHWAVGHMCRHTDIQERVHNEIANEIGPTHRVKMADRQKLPYTNAVINEVQRVGNILALNLMHSTMEDVTLRGYKIKKGTSVQGAISSILWDEDYYPNYKKFDPDRFMPNNKYGDGKNPIDMLIPFSIGKRSCLGEPLARMELLLIFTTLMQRFKFEFANEKEAAGFEAGITKCNETNRFTRMSYRYKVNISARA